MSNRRNAERARFNTKLEQQEIARFEELKRDVQKRQQMAEEKRRRDLIRKYLR
jgi:hypothetical protein